MISIIHPSRGRAEKSYQTCDKWLRSAGISDVELIISCDFDDPTRNLYDESYVRLQMAGNKVKGVTSHNKSAIDAINIGALHASGDILMVVSDDTDCPRDWAIDLLKEVEHRKDWILKTKDGIQPWIITMPVMDREYYNRFGYIYHPDYQHMWCDTELTCVAELTGRKLISNMIFPHNHYSVGKAEKDIISAKADESFESGRRIYTNRKQRFFDLPIGQMVGELPNNFYTRM